MPEYYLIGIRPPGNVAKNALERVHSMDALEAYVCGNPS